MSRLFEYLSYPFVRYALIVGVLVALCCGLLGVILVLKRFSFIGDGLSHVAFGAMAVAAITSVTNNIVVILPVTIASAIILLNNKNRKINGDAAVALISVSALAIGYLLMNIFPTSANVSADVCTTLFGSSSILTLTKFDVIISIILSLVVVSLFVLFYNKIFAATFDQDFMKSTGQKTGVYNLIIAVTIAVVIVLAMNLVGSLLISALIIFPALSSMRMFKTFKGVVICSSVIAVISSLFGMLFSILVSTPVGPTIVVFDLLIFGATCLISLFKRA